MKGRYLKQIDNYEILLNKTSEIEILYNITIFMYERTKMVSPSEYADFEKIIGGLKVKADTLDKIMISQLNEALKAPPYPTKPNNLSAVLRIGYNLGNIVSGGKLEGIINSFKGIFARTYSTTNLIIDEMQKNPTQSIFKDIPKKEGGQVIIKSEELQRIRQTTLKGVDDFNKLSKFFAIVKDEHGHLEELINNFKSNNISFEDFRKILIDDIKASYMAIDYEISDYAIDKLQEADKPTKELLTKQVEQYFNFISSGDKATFAKNKEFIKYKLEMANARLQKFEEIKQKYYTHVISLSNTVSEFKDDLNRENPFKGYEEFAESLKKWDELKKGAQQKIQTVPNEIIKNYLTYVKNKIE